MILEMGRIVVIWDFIRYSNIEHQKVMWKTSNHSKTAFFMSNGLALDFHLSPWNKAHYCYTINKFEFVFINILD